MTRADVDMLDSALDDIDMVCELLRRTQEGDATTVRGSEKSTKANTSTKIRTLASCFNSKCVLLYIVAIILAVIGCTEATTHTEPIRNGLKEIARDVAFFEENQKCLQDEISTTDKDGVTAPREQSTLENIFTNVMVWSSVISGVFMVAYVIMTIVNCKFLGVREFFTIDDAREQSGVDIAVSWFHNMLDGTQPLVNWNPTISFFIVIAVVLASFGGAKASAQMDNLPLNMAINEIAKDVPPLENIPPIDNKLTNRGNEIIDESGIDNRQESALPSDFRKFLADYENFLNRAGIIAFATITSSTIALVLGFMYSKILCSRNELPQEHNGKMVGESIKVSRSTRQRKNTRKLTKFW